MYERLPQRVDLENQTIPYDSPETETYEASASIVLELGGLAMRFARVERVPRYDEKTRESDVEHSYMLGLVASELAFKLYPESLNPSLVNDYAMVHDLIEIKTGDVATFQLSNEDLAQKEQTEQAALAALLTELPPRTRALLQNYEQQADLESRFTRAVDKLLPVVVDILGAGRKIMNEDYNVYTSAQLLESHDKLRERMAERFGEFPQLVEDYGLLCELFELEFDVNPAS